MRANRVLADITFWIVLGWAVFSARFEGWAAAWPFFALALGLLALALAWRVVER